MATGKLRGPQRGRRRDDDAEDAEDEEMEKNPQDYPFPTFTPTEAEVVRKRRAARREIREMASPLRPVVRFERPQISPARGEWCSSTHVRLPYIPKLDLLRSKTPPAPPSPPLQPVMRHTTARVIGGCPQQGIPLRLHGGAGCGGNDSGSGPRPPHRPQPQTSRTPRRIPPVAADDHSNDAAVTAAQKIVARRESLALAGRWSLVSKFEEVNAILQEPRVMAQIKAQIARGGSESPPSPGTARLAAPLQERAGGGELSTPKGRRDSFLVALPKIGMRLFATPRYVAEEAKKRL